MARHDSRFWYHSSKNGVVQSAQGASLVLSPNLARHERAEQCFGNQKQNRAISYALVAITNGAFWNDGNHGSFCATVSAGAAKRKKINGGT